MLSPGEKSSLQGKNPQPVSPGLGYQAGLSAGLGHQAGLSKTDSGLINKAKIDPLYPIYKDVGKIRERRNRTSEKRSHEIR